jgi:thiamine monophosphate kinase
VDVTHGIRSKGTCLTSQHQLVRHRRARDSDVLAVYIALGDGRAGLGVFEQLAEQQKRSDEKTAAERCYRHLSEAARYQ